MGLFGGIIPFQVNMRFKQSQFLSLNFRPNGQEPRFWDVLILITGKWVLNENICPNALFTGNST